MLFRALQQNDPALNTGGVALSVTGRVQRPLEPVSLSIWGVLRHGWAFIFRGKVQRVFLVLSK